MDFETGVETNFETFEKDFETGFETGFEIGFETGRAVLVVERSKSKNGSKRSQGNTIEEDVNHPKTMKLRGW